MLLGPLRRPHAGRGTRPRLRPRRRPETPGQVPGGPDGPRSCLPPKPWALVFHIIYYMLYIIYYILYIYIIYYMLYIIYYILYMCICIYMYIMNYFTPQEYWAQAKTIIPSTETSTILVLGPPGNALSWVRPTPTKSGHKP